MAFTTLIETGELAQLPLSGTAIIDCRFSLDDTAWGEREYHKQHVPGAVYAHLDRDLSGPKTGHNGRHPLPEPAMLATTFSRFGIDGRVQVAAYDQDSGMYASRLWWLLKWLGHDAVAVLNGGFAKWIKEGRATESGRPVPRDAREFRASPRSEMVMDVDQVCALVGRTDWRLLDARAPERYRGEIEPIDKVAGHIPGAINHPFKSNVTDTGTFKPRDELREHLKPSLGGLPPDRIVNYCGSGVTACQNILALEHAGFLGSRLYPGSWSEWSSDEKRQGEKGT